MTAARRAARAHCIRPPAPPSGACRGARLLGTSHTAGRRAREGAAAPVSPRVARGRAGADSAPGSGRAALRPSRSAHDVAADTRPRAWTSPGVAGSVGLLGCADHRTVGAVTVEQ